MNPYAKKKEIERFRKKNNWSWREFANHMGFFYHQQLFAWWSSDKTNFTLEVLERYEKLKKKQDKKTSK